MTDIKQRIAAALAPPPHGYDAQTAPPGMRPVYNTLSVSPDAEYGSILPFARNREGSAAWVQEGTNTRPAMPSAIREGLFGLADLVSGVETGQVTPRAAETLALGGAGAGGMAAPRGALASGSGPIRGWHGSPHDFVSEPGYPLGRFKDSAIGTGEGHQAYGIGHYIAGAEATGIRYREVLSGNRSLSPHDLMTNTLQSYKGDYEAAASELRKRIAGAQALPERFRADPSKSNLPEAIRLLEERAAPKGRMYEVDIHADPERFINWDKPITEQSPHVRAALSDFIDSESRQAAQLSGELQRHRQFLGLERAVIAQPKLPDWLQLKGDNIVNAFRSGQLPVTPHGQAPMPSTLSERGIPGIKYLDGGSRAAGDGSRNYVVFDPATIEILRKYGMAVPAPVGVPKTEIDTTSRAALTRMLDDMNVK